MEQLGMLMTLSDRLRELDEALSSEDQTDALGAAFDLRAALPAIREGIATLERVRENARSWHGPSLDTGQARALVVIAGWCDDALAALDAELSK